MSFFRWMKSFSFRFIRFMFRPNNSQRFSFFRLYRLYRPRNFTIVSLYRLPQQFSSLFPQSNFCILRDNFHLISSTLQRFATSLSYTLMSVVFFNVVCKIVWAKNAAILHFYSFSHFEILQCPSFCSKHQFLLLYLLRSYYHCLNVQFYWFMCLFLWAITLISTITTSHPIDILTQILFIDIFYTSNQFSLGRR